jgi:periplasmic protein TonB
MQSSEMEDKVWPDLSAGTLFSPASTTHWAPIRRWSALCWGISCAVHLLLLIAVGVLTRQSIDVPQPPPIWVSVLPSMVTSTGANVVPEPHMPARRSPDVAWSQVVPVDPDPALTVMPPPPSPELLEPERTAAPLVPENPTPELIEVVPGVQAAREPPPLLEPSRDVLPHRRSPDILTPVVPMSPPDVAQPPVPRLPHPSRARELPKRGRPPTTFDDPVAARIPPTGENRRDIPTAAVPETRRQESSPPQASLPRAAGAQYAQNPRPAYPREARRRGLEGTVLLLVEILESGRPERITIKQSSGHSLLDEAAMGAVRRWTFIPAQREGKAVRSVAEVPIVFSLRKD